MNHAHQEKNVDLSGILGILEKTDKTSGPRPASHADAVAVRRRHRRGASPLRGALIQLRSKVQGAPSPGRTSSSDGRTATVDASPVSRNGARGDHGASSLEILCVDDHQ